MSDQKKMQGSINEGAPLEESGEMPLLDPLTPEIIDKILEDIEDGERSMPDPSLGIEESGFISVEDALSASQAAKAASVVNANKEQAAMARPATRREDFDGRIFCIIGKSSSGKDTIWNTVKERFADLGIEPIIMYTTRPRRTGEVDGVEYNFITEERLSQLEDEGKVVERRDYNTAYGVWCYAIIDDGQIKRDGTYIIKEETPVGYKRMAERFGSEHVRPLYIYVDDGVRLMRALSREIGQAKPRYDEMCRRYLSDKGDFEEIDKDDSIPRFVNDNLDKCSREILEYLEGNRDEGRDII